MIIIPESGCAVVKSQSHLGNAGLDHDSPTGHSSACTSPVTPAFHLDYDCRMDQAGTGSTRRRAIRDRICPNIRSDTATSAI